jgi:hypothetical protein
MSSKPCPYEDAVVAAARSGEWGDELSSHRDGCLTCAELTLVVAALANDAEELEKIEVPPPEPASIWLRARLAARECDYRRATRAIVWVQRAAVGVGVAAGLDFVPRLWDLVERVFSSFDLSSATAGLPRAAGSPLLVLVVSMLVLGGLALWELTAAQEN